MILAVLLLIVERSVVDEVTTCDGTIVVYRANLDIILYVVGKPEQNELLLATVLETYYDVLAEVMKYPRPKILLKTPVIAFVGRNWTNKHFWSNMISQPLPSMKLSTEGTLLHPIPS